MKSPFPGMDPYLESHWRDVHHNLITFAQGELNRRLPTGLRARVEERVVVDSPLLDDHGFYPDVHVIERNPPDSSHVQTQMASESNAQPLVLQLDETITEGFIEIVDAGTQNRVVTVIEILSAVNKRPGEGREQYRHKQRELIEASVNLVEIDLLRSGRHTLAFPLDKLPPSHRTAYKTSVRRASRLGSVEVYRMPLREPLPKIAVPLRENDPDVTLDLQTIVDHCYENGRYDDLDYRIDVDPPLDGDDARWADDLLRGAGKRT